MDPVTLKAVRKVEKEEEDNTSSKADQQQPPYPDPDPDKAVTNEAPPDTNPHTVVVNDLPGKASPADAGEQDEKDDVESDTFSEELPPSFNKKRLFHGTGGSKDGRRPWVKIDQRSKQVAFQNEGFDENDDDDDDDDDNDINPYILKKRMSMFAVGDRQESDMSDEALSELHESIPRADHYRASISHHLARPTMGQLRGDDDEFSTRLRAALGEDLKDAVDGEKGEVKKPKGPQKQGWILGVLLRCLVNICGVLVFLRLTWVAGQAGIGLGMLVVLLAFVVSMLTTMSMAAICTNGEVRAGGVYYMISRSLGPEFGGAIGLVLSLAIVMTAAMNIVGFAETLRDIFKDEGVGITGDDHHDMRLIGVGVSVLLVAMVMIGVSFETKALVVLLGILIVSIVNYFVGTFISPTEEQRRNGFVGYNGEVFVDNLGPDFRTIDGVTYNFFNTFAVFFPAAAGFLGGANISGDLRDPSKSIPRGTFLAIIICDTVYLLMVLTMGSCMLRDAVGAEALAPPAPPLNVTLSMESITDLCQGEGDSSNNTCLSGLYFAAMMGRGSAFEPLFVAGVFSSSLSTALTCLVSSTKVFQAVCKDKLFPIIGFFAKGYGKNGDPKRGYVLAFLICVAVACIGTVDLISPFITNFFLMSYTLINFSCFDAAMANSPGFRPSFRMFNKWVSLLGAVLCAGVMFLISWWAALVTVIVVLILYFYLKHSKPDVNWGSSGQAHTYNDALKAASKLAHMEEHVKNFRPQILVLSGYPKNRPDLVDFAVSIARRQNLLICAQVFQGDMVDHLPHLRSTEAYRWFRNRKIRSFYTSMAAMTVRHGTRALLQSQGLGKLRPNTLLLGFKNNWQLVDPRKVHNYAGIIHDAFDLHYAVGVLRMPSGMDTHKVADVLLDSTDDAVDNVSMESASDHEDMSDAETQFQFARKRRMSTAVPEWPNMPISPLVDISRNNFAQLHKLASINKAYQPDDDDDNSEDMADKDEDSKEETNDKKASKGNTDDRKTSTSKKATTLEGGEGQTEDNSPQDSEPGVNEGQNVGYFRRKQAGNIDVWWLIDDGGLGLLLPHLLSMRKKWKGCKLRVFCAGTKMANLEADQARMKSLLKRFRIEYATLTVLPDLTKKPSRAIYEEFEELIYRWRLCPGETQENYPWKVSKADLDSHQTKIFMQLKIREKLLEHSKDATFIVVTLPVPHKFCPAGLYMTWLDTLTRGLPPTLLLRGNQQNVLTYIS